MGSRFQVHSLDASPEDSALGELEAGEVLATHTILRLPRGTYIFDVPEKAQAIQVSAGSQADLHLCIEPSDPLLKLCNDTINDIQAASRRQRVQICPRSAADLAVSLRSDNMLAFDNLSSAPYGVERMPVTSAVDQEDFDRILRAGSHFFWHLRRTSEAKTLQKLVEVEFTEIVSSDEFDEEAWPILVQKGENFVKESRIDLVIEDQKMYGLKLINTSGTRPLYPYIFYFDCSDLSIGELNAYITSRIINLSEYKQSHTISHQQDTVQSMRLLPLKVP